MTLAMTPVHKIAHLLSVASLPLLLYSGCGNFDRNNPVDPFVTGGASLGEQLIGTWTRTSGSQAQDYVFSSEQGGMGVVRVDYSAVTAGAEVNRLGSWPTTRVHTFQGIYEFVGDQLTMTFSDAHSNDPAESLTPPPVSQVVKITIQRNTLIMEEAGSKLFFTPLQS